MSDEARKTFYATIPDFWADLNGEEYALYDLVELDQSTVQAIRMATTRVSRLFTEFTNRMQQLPADDWTMMMSELGYPEASFSWLRMNSLPWPSIIARADWALTVNGPKLLEWNADTPSFIKELFDVNGSVCRHFGRQDPNEGEMERLAMVLDRAIEHAIRWLSFGSNELNDFDSARLSWKIVFSGYPDDEEDVATNRFLAQLVERKGWKVEQVALRDLLIDEHGLYTPSGERIDIWFRPGYPLEFMAEERDPEDGKFLGECVAHLIQLRQLAMINPFHALLHQNKMLQAFIWAAREEAWLSSSAKETIEQYWLPSYDTSSPFEQSQETYVIKPAFGREGGGVRIVRPGEQVEVQQNELVQRFVDLPFQTIRTIAGEREAYLLLGCFCINGQGSALGFRAGEIITDNKSYYLPTCMRG